MNQHEQDRLDAVFGRVRIKLPTGHKNPVVLPREEPTVPSAEPPKEVVARQVPKFEQAELLNALRRTLPPLEEQKTPSRPVDGPK